MAKRNNNVISFRTSSDEKAKQIKKEIKNLKGTEQFYAETIMEAGLCVKRNPSKKIDDGDYTIMLPSKTELRIKRKHVINERDECIKKIIELNKKLEGLNLQAENYYPDENIKKSDGIINIFDENGKQFTDNPK
ncbi:MAG: hypothetical protein IJH39_02465 [Clostridia bacterium]|nr:hypothetical protein [Clostridia bacterium]